MKTAINLLKENGDADPFICETIPISDDNNPPKKPAKQCDSNINSTRIHKKKASIMGGNYPRVDLFYWEKVQKKTNIGVGKDPSMNQTISSLIKSSGNWRGNRVSIDDKDMLSKINNHA